MKPIWLLLSLNLEQQSLTITGLSCRDRETAEQQAAERAGEEAEFTILNLMTPNPDEIGELIAAWLTGLGISREEAISLVRRIGRELARMNKQKRAQG